jgi:SAM-dependent methyltransferase
VREIGAALESQFLDLLACPVCRETLNVSSRGLACRRGHRFAVRDRIPLLLPEPAPSERGHEWERKQRAAIPEYQAELENPDSRRRAQVWTIGQLFGEFWSGREQGATVLDVGCGMYREQAYYRPEWRPQRVARFVGLDPMFHPGEREYEFVQGVAERLPFAAASFDVALFATSLDHIVDIDQALQEAARVLRPCGRLAVWISVFDPGLEIGVRRALQRVDRSPPWQPKAIAAYLRVMYALAISSRIGWRDQYHLHRFELPSLERAVRSAGFTIVEQLLIDDDSQSVPHLFLRAGRE